MGAHLPPSVSRHTAALAYSTSTTGRLPIGTPRQMRWLDGLVAAILLLNLGDALFTLHWISTGQAIEANPLLHVLAHDHPFLFLLAKMMLVGLGSTLLLRFRHRALAVCALFVGFLAYYWVFLYHLQAADLRLWAALGG